MKKKRKKARDPHQPTYEAASRLEKVRTMLEGRTGASREAIAERLVCSTRSVSRYINELIAQHVPLIETVDDEGRKSWRVADHARRSAVMTTTQQMLALFIGRCTMHFVKGTGFDDDLDEFFGQLLKFLSPEDRALYARLDRKIYDVQDGACDYSDRVEDFDAVMTAIVREERLEVEYTSKSRRTREKLVISPYTLVLYNKALYVLGPREGEDRATLFSLDGFHSVEWRKGDRFPYPEAWSPKAFFGDAPGVIRGKRAEVHAVFDAVVAAHATRRKWHPSAVFTPREDGSVDLRMTVDGTMELVNAFLRYGAHVEVKEPKEMREEMRKIGGAMVELYGRE